jgi:hypothetical protein
MPTSRCSGSVRSLTMASSSAGPSSGSGAGKSVSQEDSTIARVMAKPAARPANPSVRARASTQIAATSRSRDRVRRMSRAWSRASAQMPRAAGQPPSDVSPSSALRSIRRASSRRSRRAERAARPSSLACRFSPLGASPSSGEPKLVGSRSIESAMRLVSERGLEERSPQIYPVSGRRVDLAGRVCHGGRGHPAGCSDQAGWMALRNALNKAFSRSRCARGPPAGRPGCGFGGGWPTRC